MKTLLTDIELDIQELKCVVDTMFREQNSALKQVVRRKIVRMRASLDDLLDQLDETDVVSVDEKGATLLEEQRPATPLLGDSVKEEVTEENLPENVENAHSFVVENVLIQEEVVASEEELAVSPTPLVLEVEVESEEAHSDKESFVKQETADKRSLDDRVWDELLSMQYPEMPVLGERFKMTSDLRRSLSLNDSFRFSKELFGGDYERMNRILHQVEAMSSYQTAIAFLLAELKVKEDNEAWLDLQMHVQKFF